LPFAFEKLIDFQKAVTFADAACSLTKGFPQGYKFLVGQLQRAVASIATNLAEGRGRFTKPTGATFLRTRAARRRHASRCWRSPVGAALCRNRRPWL